MSLHGLLSVTIGVPDVGETAAYYTEFGLAPGDDGWFSTTNAGRQLRLVQAPFPAPGRPARRRRRPRRPGPRRGQPGPARLSPAELRGSSLETAEPVTGARVGLQVASRTRAGPGAAHPLQRAGTAGPAGHPGARLRPARAGASAQARPRRARLHRTRDRPALLHRGLGFKVSDRSRAGRVHALLDRHHNVLVQHAPVDFLHHTSWQVDDVDEIGRGATAMLAADPERHIWGLGRHHIGSNFFWYLRDPAGNFSEYYSDIDCIVEDQLWKPEVWEGIRGLYNWGPPRRRRSSHPTTSPH